jgi:uncharacterized protein YecT (DUF1311 family)
MKLIHQSFLVLGLLSLSPTVALSQCNDDEGTADSLYTKCYKPRLDESNVKLHRETTTTAKALKEHYRTKGTIADEWFKNSQVAWERYRNLYCEVHSIAEVGPQSSRALERVECEIALNEGRIKELSDLQKLLPQ